MATTIWILILGCLFIAGGCHDVSRVKRQSDGTCNLYCDIIPDNRELCPETPENPAPPNRVDTAARVAALREVMANTSLTGAAGPLAAYLIYEGSYYGGGVTEHDRRMFYISGFSGSSGHAVVTSGVSTTTPRAALWTDGRYWIQGDQELDCDWILMQEGYTGVPNSIDWLIDILPDNSYVGAAADFMDTTTWNQYKDQFDASSKTINLVEVNEDLFNHFWTEAEGRPPISDSDIYVHTIDYTGKSWQDKINDIKGSLNDTADVLIITLLDDIVWLFNLRGSDRDTSPLFDASGMLFRNGTIRLYLRTYMDKLQITGIKEHLNTNVDGSCVGMTGLCVEVRDYDDSIPDLESLNVDAGISKIWINIGVSYIVYKSVDAAKKYEDYSPIQLPKSIKNPTEVTRYRECQIRDSAHLVEFLTMLESQVQAGTEWTELSAADVLREDYRKSDPAFQMVSFFSISAVGPNGAIIHYRPSAATDRRITTTEMYLLDSGGNYLDGTTDVTRTFHFGTPNAEEVEAYTRVLMGVIDLATTVWPFGWKGSDLDARTRTPLWQNGWDYNHGTGHGIAYFINVHEGPGYIKIGNRPGEDPLYEHNFFSDGPGRINIGYDPSHEPLHEHMFFSDEPGLYLPDKFGVRLETIVEVVKANTPNTFNEKEYLTFDPVTFVPFEPNLINYDMLEMHHRKWLNWYHQKCEETTGQLLLDKGNQAAYDWLALRTEPIPESPSWTSGATKHNLATILILSTAILTYLL